MKSRLIINPVSGSDSAPHYIEQIQRILEPRFGELEVCTTEKAGDAREMAAEAVRNGCTHVFSAGGDGTLNEVLNGVANESAGFEQITFGVIPLGTGNDFANAALFLPEDVEAALQILANDKVVAVDVGKVNEYFFVNVSAGGFIAEVSEAVDPTLKSVAGKLAYLIGGAQVLLDYESVTTNVKFSYASGEKVRRTFNIEMFAVCNSKMVGGGRLIAPDAQIDDGLLDVCIFEATDTLDFLTTLAQVASGGHIGDENVTFFRVSEIEFEFEREINVNADGEVFNVCNCRYQILPGAAKFLTGEAPPVI